MQRDFSADWCNDHESMKTIKQVFKRTGKQLLECNYTKYINQWMIFDLSPRAKHYFSISDLQKHKKSKLISAPQIAPWNV